MEGNSVPRPTSNGTRYVVACLLGALLLMVAGLATGYLSLDLAASADRQLSAAGLAYGGCDEYGCYGDEVYVVDEVDDYGWQNGVGYWQPLEWNELPQGTVLFTDEYGNLPEGPFYIGEPVPLTDQYGEPILSDVPPEDAWGYPLYDVYDTGYRADLWGNPVYGREGWYDEIDIEDGWAEAGAARYAQDPWNNGAYDRNVREEWEIRDEVEDEWVTVKVEDPWYVQTFPGFGKVAQQIIPGQNIQPIVPIVRPAPSPAPPPVYPQPSCWISAEPSTVAYGGSSTLQWASSNATQASLSDVGRVPLVGTRTVPNLTGVRIVSLSVSGQGGSGSCYARILVRPPEYATPTCIISAHPDSIRRGETTSLAWGSNNASSALLSGVGAVAVNGGMYIAPQQSATYTLTVYGSGRSNSCATQVGVLP